MGIETRGESKAQLQEAQEGRMQKESRRKKTIKGNGGLPLLREGQGLGQLITKLRELIHSARHAVATTVNTLQVLTNFEIGRRIVLQEQQGGSAGRIR